LEAEDVKCKWMTSDAKATYRLNVLNKAFEVFYNARQALKCCDGKTKTALSKVLEECSDKGWGRGVTCLDNAFNHLDKNKSKKIKWTDDNVKHPQPYKKVWDGFNQLGFWGDAPEGAVNFLNALEEKLTEDGEAIAGLMEDVKSLPELLDAGEVNWKKISESLEKAEKKCDKASRALLFTSAIAAKIKRTEDASEILAEGSEYFEKVGKGVKAAGEIADAINDYKRGCRAGMSKPQAVAFVALKTVMNKVPVFGEGYAAVIGGIPDTMRFFQEQHDRTMAAIEAAGK
jgi:hypothetical protein